MQFEEYFEKYETFEKKAVFLFDVGMGGIGDFLKFYMYSLHICVENNIKLYLLNKSLLNNFIQLKHENMYIDEKTIINKEVLIRLSNIKKMSSNKFYIIRPFIMYGIDRTNVFNSIINMNDVFYFTDVIKTNTQNITNNKKYISVHLRLGDKFLETNKDYVVCPDDTRYFDENKLFNFIEQNKIKNIFFFCDNNEYKLKIKNKYDFINITNLKIGHTSLINTTEEEYLNACVEFYIISRSDEIHSASYSGFSIMAAKFENKQLFNI